MLKPLLSKSHPHLHVVYPFSTKEAMKTESQWHNCFIRNAVNTVPKLACPEAKGGKPTTGFTMLWVRNSFRRKSNYWQIVQEEGGRMLKLLPSNY
jgi:hypothetical protein